MSLRCYYSKALYAKTNRLTVPSAHHRSSTVSRKKSSSTSFLNLSAEFIKKVEAMEESVLVPTKLMDIECKDDPETPQLVAMTGSSNLYEMFSLIKNFKAKLEAMALDEDQMTSLSPLEVDDSLTLTSAQLSSLDSGHWSASSAGSCQSEEDSSLSCSSDAETVSEASYRVKRSLNSARGLIAFLVELSDAIEYIVSRYCDEFQCDA